MIDPHSSPSGHDIAKMFPASTSYVTGATLAFIVAFISST
jgi:hypothetical protein